MNTEALQKLFLEKLNSMSTDELIQRLDEVVPTGLGDVIDERRVYQYLSLSSDNFSTSFLRTQTKPRQGPARYFASVKYNIPVTASDDAVLLAA